MTWSLSDLLAGLHDDIEHRLAAARKLFGHPGTKGDASERVWLELLQTYLPARYSAERAHVVDSNGVFSDQIDVVIFDRQYSPLICKRPAATVLRQSFRILVSLMRPPFWTCEMWVAT